MPRGEPFQVLHFWDESGGFAGWYLDLWLDPDGSATWKDEDEAEAAVDAGHLDPREDWDS